MNLSDIGAKLNEIDHILGLWFRRDVVADCNERSRSAVNAFNAWVRESAEELEVERKGLDMQLHELNCQAAEIEALSQSGSEQRMAVAEPSQLEQYNRMVVEHNLRVKGHRELCGAYTDCQNEYNRRVRERDTLLQRKEQELNALQEGVKKDFDTYESWKRSRGEEEFFRGVNRLYAMLHEGLREAGTNAGTFKAYLNQVRLVRRDLSTYARRRQQDADNGVLIVPAMLTAEEECHLVVDTGSTTVALSPEMVRVAGLVDRLGDEIEVVIPGG